MSTKTIFPERILARSVGRTAKQEFDVEELKLRRIDGEVATYTRVRDDAGSYAVYPSSHTPTWGWQHTCQAKPVERVSGRTVGELNVGDQVTAVKDGKQLFTGEVTYQSSNYADVRLAKGGPVVTAFGSEGVRFEAVRDIELEQRSDTLDKLTPGTRIQYRAALYEVKPDGGVRRLYSDVTVLLENAILTAKDLARGIDMGDASILPPVVKVRRFTEGTLLHPGTGSGNLVVKHEGELRWLRTGSGEIAEAPTPGLDEAFWIRDVDTLGSKIILGAIEEVEL